MNEKVLDMGNGLSIWQIHIDKLREQDKNARIMAQQKFEVLTKIIKDDSRVESLPLVTMPNDRGEFGIISGHHRVRACRTAGVMEIYVMAFDDALTTDEIKAKQLYHNSLSGFDNKQLLGEIYESIDSISEKLKTALIEEDMHIDAKVAIDEVTIDYDFQNIHLIFLPQQKETFDNVMKVIEEDSTVTAVDMKFFGRFKKMVQKVAHKEEVRNISGIMLKIFSIIQEHYGKEPEGEGFDKRVSVRMDAQTYANWQEWKKRVAKITGFKNEFKAFEFALQEALNTPEESLEV